MHLIAAFHAPVRSRSARVQRRRETFGSIPLKKLAMEG
jgi:hypothetical protein